MSDKKPKNNNIPLQNIPIRTDEGRRIREALIGESKLLTGDLSQIERKLMEAQVVGNEIPEEAWEAAEEIAAATGFAKRAGEIAARIAEAMRRRERQVVRCYWAGREPAWVRER